MPASICQERRGRKTGLSCVLNIPSLLPLVSKRDLTAPKTYLQKKKKTSSQHAEPHHRILRSCCTDLTRGRGMGFTAMAPARPMFTFFPHLCIFIGTDRTLAVLRWHALCRPKHPLPASLVSFTENKGFFGERCSSAALSRPLQKRLAGAASPHPPAALIYKTGAGKGAPPQRGTQH